MRPILYSLPRRFIPTGVLCLLVLATGCSASGKISGKVTFKDKPLTGGTVLFVSTEGRGTGRSPISEDGSYTIEKMAAGPVKIAVETSSAQEGASGPRRSPPKSMQPGSGADLPAAAGKSSIYSPKSGMSKAEKIPPEYSDPETSGLTYTVTGGSQTHNIELKQ